jgi:hypothetical protein
MALRLGVHTATAVHLRQISAAACLREMVGSIVKACELALARVSSRRPEASSGR